MYVYIYIYIYILSLRHDPTGYAPRREIGNRDSAGIEKAQGESLV